MLRSGRADASGALVLALALVIHLIWVVVSVGDPSDLDPHDHSIRGEARTRLDSTQTRHDTT